MSWRSPAAAGAPRSSPPRPSNWESRRSRSRAPRPPRTSSSRCTREAKRSGHDRGDFVMPKVLAGPDAVTEVAAWPCHIVLNGITGSVGLHATLAALEAGRTLALANKESLIAGGPLVRAVPRPDRAGRLRAQRAGPVPARRNARRGAPAGAHRERRSVPRPQARRPGERHPRAGAGPSDLGHGPGRSRSTARRSSTRAWRSSRHICSSASRTSGSTSSCIPSRSCTAWWSSTDGSTIAQLSPPDMRLPIALALGWPDRVPDAAPGMDWTRGAGLDLRAARHRSVPVRRARQSRRSGAVAAARPCSTRPTRRPSRPSSPGGCPFLGDRARLLSRLSAGWHFGNSAHLPMCWTVRVRRAGSRRR